MRYMLLIYGDESQDPSDPTPEEMDALFEPWFAYDARWAPVIRAGEALLPTATATTVRMRDGERMVTDGPFAETREQLGGFYVIECDGLDRALEIAAECPGALTGSVEVRPIMEIPGAPG